MRSTSSACARSSSSTTAACSATRRPSCTPRTRDPRELDLLGETRRNVCACPTTEANLGDGFLPAEELWKRGVRSAFGADSNVRLDPFEEARETEGCARRLAGRRNVLVRAGDAGPAPSLWRCLTANGARASASAAPAIAAGAPADLAALDLHARRHPGVAPEQLAAAVLFTGTGALVRETWVAGASAAAPARDGVRPATCGSDPFLQARPRVQGWERERCFGFATGRIPPVADLRCASVAVRSGLVVPPVASQLTATVART